MKADNIFTDEMMNVIMVSSDAAVKWGLHDAATTVPENSTIPSTSFRTASSSGSLEWALDRADRASLNFKLTFPCDVCQEQSDTLLCDPCKEDVRRYREERFMNELKDLCEE